LQTNPDAFSIISLISSIASLILAIGAIWLSIVFYKMSVTASNATTEAAKGIASSVERLEKLFDKLYSDTFSMMRDTVSDMRKHMWPEDDAEGEKAVELVEKRTDEKFGELKRSMEQQVAGVLQQQKLAQDKFLSLQHEMSHLLDNAIVRSRQAEIEAREETAREYILRELRFLRRRRPITTVQDLMDRLRDKVPGRRVLMELERMKTEGILLLSTERIGPTTEVLLKGHDGALPGGPEPGF
jgi:hypothetical protein